MSRGNRVRWQSKNRCIAKVLDHAAGLARGSHRRMPSTVTLGSSDDEDFAGRMRRGDLGLVCPG